MEKKQIARIVIWAAAIILISVIVLQNRGVVTMHLLLWEFNMSLIVLQVLCVLAGFIIGFLTAQVYRLVKD